MSISNFQEFVCNEQDSISDALSKINTNKYGIIFVLNDQFHLKGCLSDGDFRRALIQKNNLNLDQPIANIMKTNVKFASVGEVSRGYRAEFKSGVNIVPVLDEIGHIKNLLFKDSNTIIIGGNSISEESETFIIAEIGNNHQGGFNLAKDLVDLAVESGADCVKFQMRQTDELFLDGSKMAPEADLGAQYTLDLLNKFQLSNEDLFKIFDYVEAKGVIPLCTPWDKTSLELLENYGMLAYKVASADLTNHVFLNDLSMTGKPLICSTGMATENEIIETIKFLSNRSTTFCMLHCNSTYPTPFKDVNLQYMTKLKKLTGGIVGYSGHERGFHIPIAAVSLGAKVIEKHFTIDKNLEGADHKVSLLPDEFKNMVKQIRQVEQALGDHNAPRVISQGELINRENLAKSLVAEVPIRKGDIITRNMISIKSPGQGLQPNFIDKLIGKVACRNIQKNTFFYETDISGRTERRNNYNFKRKFGVPVRYHDFHQIQNDTSLDFVEFHLSYNDLTINPKDYFKQEQQIGFAVHAPELFANDHILDLASYDKIYRQKSIENLEQVISRTLQLKKLFKNEAKPEIIVNAGGWDPNGFISKKEVEEKYQLVSEALKGLYDEEYSIAIQTMPPFPWHFGGQSYHNLFVDPDEIVGFCHNNEKVRICLDTSHTMMAANYYGWDFYEAIIKLLPYTSHLHVVDALGVDGEGIGIGEGDIDFTKLCNILRERSPKTQFIPEIWQGHKNSGEGFWKALKFLERFNI